jgi:hypothetical protein
MVPRGGLPRHNGINLLSISGTPNCPARSLGFLGLCPTTNERVPVVLPSNGKRIFLSEKIQ